MADIEREIGAFNAGAEAAAGIYGEDSPHDSCFEYPLPDGRVIRVLAAERAEDPETIAAIIAVQAAAENQLKADECIRNAPRMCNECPYNEDGSARCQCV